MFKSYWVIAVAFGLAVGLAVNSLQAQEQTDGSEDGATRQEQPSQSLPIPLPVQVVEDDETAEARQRREEEASQREIDDLVAQKGMNAATQSMNEATQRMAFHSLLSAIFVGVGTGLLVWTLWLTRQANRAAVSAVEITDRIGRDQLRAYLHFDSTVITKTKSGTYRASLVLKNYGQTPAREIRRAVLQGIGADMPDYEVLSEFGDYSVMADLGPQQTVTYHFDIAPETVETINGDSDPDVRHVKWVGKIFYRDISNRQFFTVFAYKTRPGEQIEIGHLHIAPHGNYST